jgi:hypothetical protein
MIIAGRLSESALRVRLLQARNLLGQQQYYHEDLRLVEGYNECFRKQYLISLIHRLNEGIDASARQSLAGRMITLSVG